jgi:hypothetical protein
MDPIGALPCVFSRTPHAQATSGDGARASARRARRIASSSAKRSSQSGLSSSASVRGATVCGSERSLEWDDVVGELVHRQAEEHVGAERLQVHLHAGRGAAGTDIAEATLNPATKLSCETCGPAADEATFHREPKFRTSGMTGIGTSRRTGEEPCSTYP